jgi:hypothetical protein
MRDTILLMTYKDHKTGQIKLPHLSALKDSNPTADIHIIEGQDSGYGKHYDWKNSDQQLRNWWKLNSNSVHSDEISIIEWDTLITCELPKLSDNLDLASKTALFENISLRKTRSRNMIKRMRDPAWTSDYWMWWNEVPMLELQDNQQAVGLVSFGFYATRKWVLDKIVDSKWDKIFNKSIQNELRFPTIASLCGAKVGEIILPFVEFDDIIPQEQPGIYHGVNQAIK